MGNTASPDLGDQILSTLGSALGAVAPTIATVLTAPVLGPAAPLAGVAVRRLADSLLGAPAADAPAPTLSEMAQAVAGVVAAPTPDQLLAIRRVEAEFKDHLADLEVSLAQLDGSDRANARSREAAVHDHTPTVLAYGVTLGYFALLILLLHVEVPASSRDLFNILLGALTTAWIAVITYYFGSSTGANQARDALAKVAGGGR